MSVETDIKLIDNASKILANINDKVDKLHDKVDIINNTSIKPKDMVETESAFGKLVGSSKGLLGTFSQLSMSLYGVKEVFNSISSVVGTITSYSDTLSETNARLNLMNDGLMSSDELWDSIYQSSIRSRGSVVDTADAVAKLGLTTKGVFKNNKELVQFSENLTKSFKIAGTSTQGISASMLQLSQAMASGVLRGEELNSVFENAPLLIQNIADYMEVPIGQIRDLASEGKITADIVKNAILDATDEINQKFDKMPMKFEELGTQFSNIWYNNMQMVQDDLEGIPQSIADNLLPVWDAFTYALFTDLDGVYKSQQKGINDTASAYANFAEDVAKYTGQIIDANEAMKVQFVSSIEMFETLSKKTINLLLNVIDVFSVLVSGVDVGIKWVYSSIMKNTSIGEDSAKMYEEALKGFNQAKEKAYNYDNIANDKYFGVPLEELSDTITQEAIQEVVKDKNGVSTRSIPGTNGIDVVSAMRNQGNKYEETNKESYSPVFPDSISSNVSNIARDISDISKSINNLNDLNKAIMEINEATYHNNVANQFNGNISITNYGVDEEGQKAIGKATEDAIRKVFLNDYQNTQAMGVYA